jgi:predicted RNase H-like nuclease (RuvC/YqgF family)
LRERENEVHSWRIKYEGAMKRASMVDELDKKFGSLKSERDTLARGLEEKTRTIGNLEQNLLDHENLDQFVISLLAQKVLFAAEFERLHGRITDLEGENIAMQERMILLGESETAIAKLEHMMEELANEN